MGQSVQPFFVILFGFFPHNDNDQLKYISLCLLDSFPHLGFFSRASKLVIIYQKYLIKSIGPLVAYREQSYSAEHHWHSSSKSRIIGRKLLLSSISACLCLASLSREVAQLGLESRLDTLTWPSFRPLLDKRPLTALPTFPDVACT